LLGPQIDLRVDAKGRGNWELLSEAMQAEAKKQQDQPPRLEPGAKSAGGELQLALQRLRVEDGRLSYSDAASKSEYLIEQLHIGADNLVPGGEPGRVEAHAQLSGTALAQAVHLRLDSTLALDKGLNGLRLQPANIKLESGTAAAEINLRGHLRRDNTEQPWQLQLHLNAEADPLRPWLDVLGSEVVTQSRAVLRKLSVETDIAGSETQLALEPLQIQLDDTVFAGNAQLRNGKIPALELTLRGGALILDDYLPPPSEAPSETPDEAQTQAASTAAAAPLPLESMRGFNAKLDLALEQLNAVELQMDQPQLQLAVNNGLYQLQKLAAGLYGGELNSSGQFDARGKSAVADLTGGLSAVEISQVQQALFADEKVQLSGKADINWAAQTTGGSSAQLQKNLRAAVQLASSELALAPFNLEKSMCQLMSYVEKTPLPEKEWPERTRLQDLRANISLEGDQAEVQQINAGIENIALAGDGKIDLEKQQFDFALGLALVGEKTSADGCSVQNERWRNRPLPLRCKDSFADAGAGSCKPDSRRLDDLIRDELKYKAEKKYGDKVEEKVEDLKDKLKGLFKR
jgi:AsmA protein